MVKDGQQKPCVNLGLNRSNQMRKMLYNKILRNKIARFTYHSATGYDQIYLDSSDRHCYRGEHACSPLYPKTQRGEEEIDFSTCLGCARWHCIATAAA